MIGYKIPRYLLFVLTLGASVAVIILSMFFAEYRWLAKEITTTSATEQAELLKADFEKLAGIQMHATAHFVAEGVDPIDSVAVMAALNHALADNVTMTGLRFVSANSDVHQAGSVPDIDTSVQVTWLPDEFVMTYPLVRDDRRLGMLVGSFALHQLRADIEAFANKLRSKEAESRQFGYALIGAGTVITLLLCGGVVWLIVRGQMARIRDLKVQAEKLRDADFGEPIPIIRGDELGELATVFNDMRDRLRSTTISRDYLDSILSGMNEAIIVTAADATIERINKATTLLLGYDEDELVGTSIDDIVNKEKTGDLAEDSLSGVPREAFFESKFGESVPVSYTCSVIEGKDGHSENRIYAAQNIAERRRAEQRIRYLARIDALTKIPNRMQFQHLLQRSIARARRAGKPLCLFYIDIDHFKDINDTFGHLAGDATLETVAERLSDRSSAVWQVMSSR
jgi:PAS domain S-box-containing protein